MVNKQCTLYVCQDALFGLIISKAITEFNTSWYAHCIGAWYCRI